MKRYCAAGLAFLFLLGNLNAQASMSNYHASLIASGDNRPDFAFSGELKSLIISIHNRVRPEEFRKSNGWSPEKYDQWVSFLGSKGFLERKGQEVHASCMIINDREGRRLHEYAEPISQAIADSIVGMRERLRDAFSATRPRSEPELRE